MGSAHRIQLDGGVRYVSPAAAHLFAARAASGGVPNLSSSESDWRYMYFQQQQQQQGFGQDEGYQASGGGEFRQEQQNTEIQRPSPPSPVASVKGVTSPQAYLEAILLERGYDSTPRSSASDGCRCTPTQKQLDDYQVPLVEAVRRWDMGALEALAADGVDMGASNRFGESIVHLATRRGSTPVLRFLLSHGGSLRICDDYGKTPLHDAFWTAEPRFELVAMMLEMDWGLLRATDVRGATPLRYAKNEHWASWCEFLDRVKDHLWPHLPPGGGAT
ncbi:unnamed protein product [Ectocarpus sp. CCAP 1310/34]|nr:unnamed protein product [Ectocarpus sp. CCAP 1310/34]